MCGKVIKIIYICVWYWSFTFSCLMINSRMFLSIDFKLSREINIRWERMIIFYANVSTCVEDKMFCFYMYLVHIGDIGSMFNQQFGNFWPFFFTCQVSVIKGKTLYTNSLFCLKQWFNKIFIYSLWTFSATIRWHTKE